MCNSNVFALNSGQEELLLEDVLHVAVEDGTVKLRTLFGEPIHKAVGTAALFGLVISLPGTIGFVVAGLGDPRLPPGTLGFVSLIGFALIAPATVLTAPFGAKIAHAFPAKKLSMLFGVFLLIAAARLYYRAMIA